MHLCWNLSFLILKKDWTHPLFQNPSQSPPIPSLQEDPSFTSVTREVPTDLTLTMLPHVSSQEGNVLSLTTGNAEMSTGLGWRMWALQTPAKTWGEGREGAEQACSLLSLCPFILRCTYTTHNTGNGQPSSISRAEVTGRKGKKRISSGKLHQMVCTPLSFLRKPISCHEHRSSRRGDPGDSSPVETLIVRTSVKPTILA